MCVCVCVLWYGLVWDGREEMDRNRDRNQNQDQGERAIGCDWVRWMGAFVGLPLFDCMVFCYTDSLVGWMDGWMDGCVSIYLPLYIYSLYFIYLGWEMTK